MIQVLLNKIDELELLNKIGQKIFITSIIRGEFGMLLPEWIFTADPENHHHQDILKLDLDEGEASAIALSLEMENSMLILDDLKGRKKDFSSYFCLTNPSVVGLRKNEKSRDYYYAEGLLRRSSAAT